MQVEIVDYKYREKKYFIKLFYFILDSNPEIDIDDASQDDKLAYNEEFFDEANLTINYESGENFRIVKLDNPIYYDLKEESLDGEIVEEHLLEREDEEDEIEDALETQLEEFLIPHTSKVQLPETRTIKRKLATFQHSSINKKQKIDTITESVISKFKYLNFCRRCPSRSHLASFFRQYKISTSLLKFIFLVKYGSLFSQFFYIRCEK